MCTFLVCIFVDGIDDNLGILQSFCINVIQCNFAVAQYRACHAVPKYISGENSTSGTHKCNFYHAFTPPLLYSLLLFVPAPLYFNDRKKSISYAVKGDKND